MTCRKKLQAIMTDSVSKNLKNENGVEEQLRSNYKPTHLLCKSHLVEAFDRANIDVLSQVDKKVNFREKLESINPSKSFLRREQSVAVCGLKSILNVVSHDKSASSANQVDLFDFILQWENQVKHMSLYRERRFTRLSYSAASILNAPPYQRMLLNETHLSNQHVEIVRMFLDSKFFITELTASAYSTHRVSLSLLHFVEVNSQDKLLEIFPGLFQDLKNEKMDALSDYLVVYKHVPIEPPTSETDHLLKAMCQKLHC